MPAHNTIDLSGARFGRLTVVARAPKTHPKKAHWSCLCDCGRTSIVWGSHLRSGLISSCGCLRNEMSLARTITHGLTRSPEYSVWCGMKRRCYNKHDRRYMSYGGRGIRLCPTWEHSFETFIADMGQRPTPNHSIERIDVDGNYCKDNCAWIPLRNQAFNKRSNKLFSAYGATRILAEWSRVSGVSYKLLQSRISRGWDIQKAIETPLCLSKSVPRAAVVNKQSST